MINARRYDAVLFDLLTPSLIRGHSGPRSLEIRPRRAGETRRAAGPSSSRVHQIVAAADLDELDATLSELRAVGWPAPEDPDGDEDAELDGRELIADRLGDEAGWLRQCSHR